MGGLIPWDKKIPFNFNIHFYWNTSRDTIGTRLVILLVDDLWTKTSLFYFLENMQTPSVDESQREYIMSQILLAIHKNPGSGLVDHMTEALLKNQSKLDAMAVKLAEIENEKERIQKQLEAVNPTPSTPIRKRKNPEVPVGESETEIDTPIKKLAKADTEEGCEKRWRKTIRRYYQDVFHFFLGDHFKCLLTGFATDDGYAQFNKDRYRAVCHYLATKITESKFIRFAENGRGFGRPFLDNLRLAGCRGVTEADLCANYENRMKIVEKALRSIFRIGGSDILFAQLESDLMKGVNTSEYSDFLERVFVMFQRIYQAALLHVVEIKNTQ